MTPPTRVGNSPDRNNTTPADASSRRTSAGKAASLFGSMLPELVSAVEEGRFEAEPERGRKQDAMQLPPGPATPPQARPRPVLERRDGEASHDDRPADESSQQPDAVKRVRRAIFRDHGSRQSAMAELVRLIALLYGRSRGPTRGLRIVPPAPNPLRLTLSVEVHEGSLCVLARSDLDATRRPEVLQALSVLESLLREKLAPLAVNVQLLA